MKFESEVSFGGLTIFFASLNASDKATAGANCCMHIADSGPNFPSYTLVKNAPAKSVAIL